MTIRWPRLLTPTRLSQIIRKQKNPLKALQIFNEAKSRCSSYHHNGSIYATLINILGSSGHIDEMKKVIAQMKDDSCECRDSVFASAIKTYASAGLLDEAISLFRNLPQFNCVNWTESFNTLLGIMVRKSQLGTVHHLFLENIYRWEVKSRTHSLNLLIGALCQINRSDLALQVLLEMNYQCCYPDDKTYQILMGGLCKDGRLNDATHLLYSMFWRISQKGSGKDIVTYRTLLDALCDNEQVQDAVEILRKVLRKELKTTYRYCKQLDLSNCRDDTDIQRAKILISEALIRVGIRSSDSSNAMAVDLYSEGKIEEASSVLKQMHDKGVRPPPWVYEAKVAALCRGDRVDEAVEVIDREIVEGNCVPSVRLYNIVIKGLCDERKSTLALGYLPKMSRQVGCVPDEETYTTLVDGLCHEGRYIEASGILEEMLIKSHWPNVDTYNVLIRGLCLIGRPYDAVMWLEEMVTQAKIPARSVWNSLVNSICCDTVISAFFFEGMIVTRELDCSGSSTSYWPSL